MRTRSVLRLQAVIPLFFLVAGAMAQQQSNPGGDPDHGAAVPGSTRVITEITGMTVNHSFIDMDAVGPEGVTNLAAINAAGTNGGATIKGITLSPSAAAQGVYNTNPNGRALARLGTDLYLVDPTITGSTGIFDAFDAQIDLTTVSTEIGVAVSDWNGPMIMDFYLGGVLQDTHTTSNYSSSSLTKYFQSSTGFDQVNIRASTSAGNWVIPELYIEKGAGFTLSVTGPCPAGGQATASVTGATGSGNVAFAYSFTLGNQTVSGGGCVNVTLGIMNPVLVGIVQADAQGNASLQGPAPAGACGKVHVQAVDLGTCTASNVVSYN